MRNYRIDDLAQAAGTTVRNVRVYQDRGLLPPPRREGRVGIYTDAHLARLRVIGQLLERGYTFSHIAELIAAWQHGRDLGEVLGLEAALVGPWSDELPDYVTRERLGELFGTALTDDLLERAVGLHALEPEGDRYRVPSPRLLHAGAELVAAGIPLPAVLDLTEALAADVEVIAARLVDTVATHLAAGHGDDLGRLAALIQRLRPLAQMAVDAHLASAMERRANAAFGDLLTGAPGSRPGSDEASAS